jgi:hypothetical protein
MSELNIFQRINEIRKLIDYIKKDKSVSTGASGSYKAVTHDQVTALVRDHMVNLGVVSYPVLVSSTMNPPLEGAKQSRYEATYDFYFVNIDKPEDKFVVRIEAHAMDNADKATGKALSYAKKYAILKLLEIETGEDEESRYQEKEEFNLKFWSDILNDCADVASLEKSYLEAKSLCLKLGDSHSMKVINNLTVKIKSELSK